MDWKRRKKKVELDKIGRANPTKWYHYRTVFTVVKIMKNEEPKLLHESLLSTCYTERRKLDRYRFYDSTAHRIGHGSLCNRIANRFQRIDFDHKDINDHLLSINLKRCFF